jgi:Domain of unknown function (DUF1987).
MPMQELHISPTRESPEVHFSPNENIFLIRGISTPEDVRAMYYPVIEWIRNYINYLMQTGPRKKIYTPVTPLKFKVDLEYFNSSSAKFLYDIFMELQRLIPAGIPFIVEWLYDKEDIDLKEAGSDIASLAGMDFIFVPK